MTYARRRNAGVVVIIVLLAALLCGFASPGIRGGVASALNSVTEECTYYNDWAQTDAIDNNQFNFSGEDENGDNPYEAAERAVNDGKANSVQAYIYTNDGNGNYAGELIRRVNPHDGSSDWDPALLAALCLDAENRTGMVILADEQGEPVARRADAAHLHFLKDRAYAEACYDKLAGIWSKANVSIKQIVDYTSSMYMWPNGLEGDKPAVIVRNSQNTGGHVIIFDLGEKAGVLKYRIECGFQPIDIEYWPTPDQPPVPDNPEPVPEPTPPGPTPEPKDPNAGPQGQHPDNPDYGGGPNTNNDTTVTDDPMPEKNSPDEYVAPAPPSADDEDTGGGNDAPAKKPDASANTDSGSRTVDQDNGRQETYTDPDTGQQDTGTVQAGDGRDHGDFAEHIDNHPATVETGANPAPTTDEPSPGNGECEAPE